MAPEPHTDPTKPPPSAPDAIETPVEFTAALAAVKGSRSYSALTAAAGDLTPTAARRASGVADWSPEPLTRGTVSDWLSGRSRPTRAKLLTFLVVCDVAAEQVPAWLGALDRVRDAGRPAAAPEQAPPAPPPPDAGPADPAPSRLRRPAAVLVAAAAAVVVVVAVLTVPWRGTSVSPAAADPAVPGCSVAADGAAVVQPQVTTDGSRLGMTFCPVVINGGRLPITGPFELAGQVLGPIGERSEVLLLNHGDPRTCDALGNRPAQGSYVMSQALIGSPDGRWSYVDRLGYSEAVTIARRFQFVTASEASLQALRGDAAAYHAAHPGADDYPGVASLPGDAKILATFDVPAGEYPEAVPCADQ